jgi:hypothetical protein
VISACTWVPPDPALRPTFGRSRTRQSLIISNWVLSQALIGPVGHPPKFDRGRSLPWVFMIIFLVVLLAARQTACRCGDAFCLCCTSLRHAAMTTLARCSMKLSTPPSEVARLPDLDRGGRRDGPPLAAAGTTKGANMLIANGFSDYPLAEGTTDRVAKGQVDCVLCSKGCRMREHLRRAAMCQPKFRQARAVCASHFIDCSADAVLLLPQTPPAQ